jgi:thioredoxin 1
MSNISAISDSTFENEVVDSDVPVLVDFWAQWCGPCKAIAPILDDIAQQYSGKLKIVKLDVDSNPATPPKFGVRGIPTLIIFKDGQVQATQVGLVTKSELSSFIDGNI